MSIQKLVFFIAFALLTFSLSARQGGFTPDSVVMAPDLVKYPELNFNPNQGIFVFKDEPSREFREFILSRLGINTPVLSENIRKCNTCDTYMELWDVEDIGTNIQARALTAGSQESSRIVGEGNEAAAFVNLISVIPTPSDSNMLKPIPLCFKDSLVIAESPNNTPENTIIIAVLDTGIDLNGSFANSSQIWENPNLNQAESNRCLTSGEFGWNFIKNNNDIQDDHVVRIDNPIYHGTKVSQLIVDQFRGSSVNNAKIMTLKTHDHTGSGDLFSNICAIHYAMDHGAHIINASWGFYYDKSYFENSYFKELITTKLSERGIIFVTASGNQFQDGSERNLSRYNFLPAVFGNRDNNIFVATTNIGGKVSPKQNYSSNYVDFGVHAQYTDYSFKPWVGADMSDRISGSSYATAILAGKIGANTDLAVFRPGISKRNVVSHLRSQRSTSLELLFRSKVRRGSYIRSNTE